MSKYGVVWFDCDGVLTDHNSCWVYLHSFFGSSCNSLFSQLYRDGYISYLDWMIIDIALMINSHGKLIYKSDVEHALSKINLRKNARDVVDKLREYFVIGVISSGVDILVERICSEISSDICLYNELLFVNNILIPGGKPNVPLKEKPVIIKNYSEKLGFKLDRVVYVGDSEWDIDVFRTVGLPIAVKPCGSACNYAKYVVDDLEEIVNIVYEYFGLRK